jgi:hypothetical protein|tara:strand:- start:81 stop:227 length:147 start_codon:yes stop_codon:yes gene_type:complete
MTKQEMIDEVKGILQANEDNPNCSVFWLADMIKEIVTNTDLKESDNET